MEEFLRILYGVIMAVAAVGVMAIGIYNCFFKPDVLKSPKWRKTTAKVVDRHHYKKTPRPSVTRAKPQYVDCYEKIISYTVNGKEYKKTLPDEYEGKFEIYYKITNPNHFVTLDESKNKEKNVGIFISCIIFSLMLAFFSFLIFSS